MINRTLFLFIYFIPILLKAQIPIDSAFSSAVHFESGLTWKQIKAKAKAEGKYIFVDCYATWCIPCKYMNDRIFPVKEVGEFINSHFISITVQMDRTKHDQPAIQAWYTDAKLLETAYTINAYPTYLIFSPDGVPVHRIVGAIKEPDEFIAKVSDGLNPQKQYYNIVEEYKDHKGDSTFLLHAVKAALEMTDMQNAALIGNLYIDCLKNPFSKDNLEFITLFSYRTADKGFKLFYKYPKRVDNVLGKKTAEYLIMSIIKNEEIDPFFQNDSIQADWNQVSDKLYKLFPRYAGRIIAEAKPDYFALHRQWKKYEDAVLYFLNTYGKDLSAYDINSVVWKIFLYSDNPHILNIGLKWSKKTIPAAYQGQSPYFDTYANLLYKLGDAQNAVSWENKAVEYAIKENNHKNKKEFEATLVKMQVGEKTWK